MKVLGVMQNQWFREPERYRAMVARLTAGQEPLKARATGRDIGARMMFGTSNHSGAVLQRHLGPDWCSAIHWTNASPEIGGESRACPPADLAHLRQEIEDVRPTKILCLGKVAAEACADIWQICDACGQAHGPNVRRCERCAAGLRSVDRWNAEHPAARSELRRLGAMKASLGAAHRVWWHAGRLTSILLPAVREIADEQLFQTRIAECLRANGVMFEREKRWDERNRFDFWLPLGGTVLETKVAGGESAVARQLKRYADLDGVEEVVLISRKPMPIPESLNGKPIRCVALWKGML